MIHKAAFAKEKFVQKKNIADKLPKKMDWLDGWFGWFAINFINNNDRMIIFISQNERTKKNSL